VDITAAANRVKPFLIRGIKYRLRLLAISGHNGYGNLR